MAWIDSLFQRMVQTGSSDLHMTSSLVPMFRLDGEMVAVEGCPPITAEQMLNILFEIAPEGNKHEYQKIFDTDFAYELADVGRFRVNLFRDHRGPGGVFRLIPTKIPSAESLGLPKSVLDLCQLSKGLVLVTGPTGSGKSTTLASMIDNVNTTRSDHVITIEDPIEFVHTPKKCLINQREVRQHTESFKRALRAALREDPDIVLVGELRDLETIEIAIETAETGHLVFGTLHTTTAHSAVDRIIDQFPAERQSQVRTMLASSLRGVVAQTLLKKATGGRVAALEVLIVNSGIAANIREGKTHQIPSLMQMNGKIGCKQLNDALFELVLSGAVDANEAYRKCIQKEDFLRKCQQAQISLALQDEAATEPLIGGPAQAAMGAPSPRGPLPHAQAPAPTPLAGSRIPSPGQSAIPRR
ncbi:MAG: type IV pilus twitching motility protein PilT [Planctomycetes bacterium]|nr:type IV pilus twitching motility protein PilT [Planctomycetota bacterium]